MGNIRIEINGDPPRATSQQKGERVVNGRIFHYTKKKVQNAKDWYRWHMMQYRPEKPIEGPVKLTINWLFELKRAKATDLKITRPDLDNLEKACLDVITELQLWRDDAQVAVKHTEKWTVPPGKGKTIILIEEVNENDGPSLCCQRMDE